MNATIENMRKICVVIIILSLLSIGYNFLVVL